MLTHDLLKKVRNIGVLENRIEVLEGKSKDIITGDDIIINNDNYDSETLNNVINEFSRKIEQMVGSLNSTTINVVKGDWILKSSEPNVYEYTVTHNLDIEEYANVEVRDNEGNLFFIEPTIIDSNNIKIITYDCADVIVKIIY